MIVIVYLQRVAAPLRVFLRDVFGTLHAQGKLDPFKPEDIKVLVLDSVRGVTADYVHVIRGERSIGAQDQYLGIQGDLRREYISYTRGRLLCHVWLDDNPSARRLRHRQSVLKRWTAGPEGKTMPSSATG